MSTIEKGSPEEAVERTREWIVRYARELGYDGPGHAGRLRLIKEGGEAGNRQLGIAWGVWLAGQQLLGENDPVVEWLETFVQGETGDGNGRPMD
jgi:hypothetical protein